MDNLEKMDRFLEKSNLPRLSQEEIEIINNELGRSPGEGKGSPFQYSALENSMDCIVHGVAKSWTQLSDLHFHGGSIYLSLQV